MKPGKVAQEYNLSYVGGRDQEDQFEASPGKKFTRPNFNQWLSVIAHNCYPSYVGKHK
jgi:hypothetical protein